jgi:hypothetical protein
MLLCTNYFFASESLSLDGRRKLPHMIQVLLASAVSPKTAFNIYSPHEYRSSKDISIPNLS